MERYRDTASAAPTPSPLREKTSTPSEKEVCLFLAEYGAWLLGCGATCIRLEKNVQRMAETYGKKVELTITPRHIHVSVLDVLNSETVTTIASVKAIPVSFNLNTLLSQLSWEIADQRLGFDAARERFHSIIHSDSQSRWTVLLLVTLANASFCRLFGGDLWAMAVVGIATLAGYYLKQVLLANKVDIRVVVLACAFVSSVLGASCQLFSLGDTPAVATATSILYLVPGIPFLNSFSDMLYRYYICSFSRFMDAVVLTASLSIGLCAGMALMKVGMF